MADENAAPGAGGGESGKSPLVLILVVLNTIIIAVVAFLQYQAHQKELNRPSIRDVVKAQMMKISEETDKAAVKGQEESEGPLLQLQGFVANLAQGEGPRRYIRLTPVLRFSKDAKDEEFNARKPQIRDTIISILNSKRPEDLLKVEGKAHLKEEIKSSINSFMVDGRVTDIYYIEFQIK